MSDNSYTKGDMNIAEQRRTYESVMRFSVNWGVPASIAVAALVAFLLMDMGLLPSIFFAAIILFAVQYIGKTFFTH
ncbi:MAG: aa3-type cytochrome c oxidase subunit IV [bacterium]